MKIQIDSIAVAQLKSGHRIYASTIGGELYFYEPGMDKWIPLEMEFGTHEDYENYRKLKFEKDNQ